MVMFLSIGKPPNNISQGDKPNPKATQALQGGSRRTIWRNENDDAISVSKYEFSEAMQRHTKICSEV